jgi:hypothetical protein
MKRCGPSAGAGAGAGADADADAARGTRTSGVPRALVGDVTVAHSQAIACR